MASNRVGKQRVYLHISPSISNFRDKLLKRTGLLLYHPIKNMFSPVVFFGMYNPADYLRLIAHKGRKTIFWCGGDILNLQKGKWRPVLLYHINKAKNICENETEQRALIELGIRSSIHPMIFCTPNLPLGFTKTDITHVYMTAHAGRENEYGITSVLKMAPLFPNIYFHIYGVPASVSNPPANVKYHGAVDEEQFNLEIPHYHAALRLNRFDGFSEILAKSALLGQYPISWIPYHHITHVYDGQSLAKALVGLQKKRKPNLEARKYWADALRTNLLTVLQ